MAIVINGSGTVTGISVGGLPDGIVDNGTMADDAIAIADLAATGTASSSTYLRGDNSWATISSFDPDGAQVFNETGADVDFRVESNGNANMLFVDGGENRIGIGINNPGVQLANISGTGTNIGAGGINWNNSEASKYVAQFRNGSDPGWGISVKLGISAPDATDKYIDFIDDQGVIQASLTGTGQADGGLGFQTAGTTRLKITEAGDLDMPVVGDTQLIMGGAAVGDYGKISFDTGNFHGMSINSNGTSDYIMSFNKNSAGTGSIQTTASNCSFNTSSDYRLKENVVDMTDAITRLKTLQPRRFNWIIDETNTLVDGFIAHEVTAVPEAVQGEKDAMAIEARYTEEDIETQGENPTKEIGEIKSYSATKIDPQGIDQSKLVPLLVGALQEAITRIEALENP